MTVYDPFEREPPYRAPPAKPPEPLPFCRRCGQRHDAPIPSCPNNPSEPDYERRH